MKGSRPLTDQEIKEVLNNLETPRNQCLFVVGLRTGFRISELLSLTVGDCIQWGKVKDAITVQRKSMKGKISGRTVVLHKQAWMALTEVISTMDNGNDSNAKLFPFTRQQAHRIIKAAVDKAKLEGKITTHSMRKSYASRMHEKLGRDILKTQKAMGHANIQSTVQYLSFNQEEIDNAIREG